MTRNTTKGFALICQINGALETIVRDDFGFFKEGSNNVVDCFDGQNKKEVEDFLQETSSLQAFCERQIRICQATDPVNILLSGTPYGSKILFMGTTANFYEKRVQEMQLKLVEMKRRLKHKSNELDQFAHIVSHDLKAPLSQTKLIVHLLGKKLRKETLSSEAGQLLQMLDQSASQMADLIDMIHRYSKSGLFDYSVATFSLDELLEEITSNIKSSNNIMFHFPDKLHDITTNRSQLLQVLSQLMDNAVQYHHLEEGNVTLRFQEKEDVYWFEVVDDGPGIPNEYQENIFEVFNKTNHKSRNGRQGVGLSIAKKLVENAGGVLSLASKVGSGSNFRFSWPKKGKQLP